MRVTQNMSSSNSIYNIMQARAKLDKLQEVTSSGYNVNRPSDDPIAARLLLDVGNNLKATNQHASNITKATNFMSATSTALEGMSSIMTLAKKAVGDFVLGTTDADKQANTITLLNNLKQQLIDMGNTQINDQYIFGGAQNTTPPFQQKNGNLTLGNTVIPNINIGGTLKVGMQVLGAGIPAGTVISALGPLGPGLNDITLSNAATITSPSSLKFYTMDETAINIEIASNTTEQMNIVGNQLLTADTAVSQPYGSTNILETFDDLVAAINDNGATPGLYTTAASALEDGAKQITNAQTTLAYRIIRLDSLSTMHGKNKTTLENIVGSTQDADYAKLAIASAQQQTAFEASLSSTAKLSRMSLLDYL